MYACKPEGGNGEIISTISNEINKVTKSGDKTFGIIMTTMLQSKYFIKSPALQKSFKKGFDPEWLTLGDT